MVEALLPALERCQDATLIKKISIALVKHTVSINRISNL
tara:strand:- start:581 stop:697 length:117 start_codon:yes stop_codon:yes gene_type:complete